VGRYEACPGSIVHVAADGTRTPFFADRTCDEVCRKYGNWGPVLLSPDGKTVVAAERRAGCSTYYTTYFLPARGGSRAAVPLTGDRVAGTQPLGWLDSSDAVIVEDGTFECGDGPEAIMLADPRGIATEVVAANGGDATAWGLAG
jgi:hypothetical protein